MDIKEALELLKQYRGEIDHLKTLKHDNDDWTLWKNKVNVVLEAAFGKDSSEYLELDPPPSNAYHWKNPDDPSFDQKEYLNDLKQKELGITKILQKYDILGISIASEINAVKRETERPKAFIAHGGESEALSKLSDFLIALGIDPLVVEHQASKDMTLDSKVEHYLEHADCAIILATGDDEINGKLHPRQNVIHETGLAQKSFPGKIIYLLEEGAEFPSNISPKVWQRFTKEIMDQAFIAVARELRELGIIKAVKPQ